MVGNVAGLYSFTSSNVVVPSNNNTGLYNDNGGFIPVSDNIDISGNITAGGFIFANGNIATNSYFVGDGSQLTNISANSISGLYGNANVEAYLASGTNSGNIITLGNISGSYYLGNAAFMSGLPTQYSNANVAAYLPIYTGNLRAGNVTVLSNIAAGNIQTTGTGGNITGADYIYGNFFVGDGSLLTNVASSFGNAQVAAFLASGTDSSNIITTGNVSGTYILGNGSQLTGLPATYSNAEVATFLANFGSNVISTTGNVTAGYFVGNGSTLTNLTAANITGTVANATYATSAGSATTATQATVADSANSVAGGNVTGQVANALVAGTVYTAAQPAITSLGTLTGLSVAANISAGNISTSGNVTVGGTLHSDDITSVGDVTVYGNQIITGNLTVQGNTTTINSNVITTNDKTITVANNQSTGANVNGAGLEAGNPAIATWLYNDATTSWQSNISVTPGANLTNNLGTDTLRWATVYAGDANLSGNITAGYFIGNGSQLTDVVSSYGDANVATFLSNYGANTISSTGNITTTANISGGNLLGTIRTAAQPSITSVGALTSLSVQGNISTTTGNFRLAETYGIIFNQGSDTITLKAPDAGTTAYTLTLPPDDGTSGQFLRTDGSGTTTWATPTGSYGNANVATFLSNYGSNTISSTGNITTTANIAAGNVSATTAVRTPIVNGPAQTNLVLNAFGLTTDGNIIVEGATSAGNIQLNPRGSSQGRFVNISANTNVTGNVEATGNVTGSYFIGNGSQLTGITSTYGDSNVTTLLASLGSNVISSTANITTTGNVAANSAVFSTGGKITGDFSSGAQAGRTLVQTTNTGTTAPTYLTVMPGPNNTGTAFGGHGILSSGTDPGNASLMSTQLTTTDGRIQMARLGTGSFLPFTIYTSNAERFRTDINGNIGIANTAPLDKLSVNGTGYFSSNVSVAGLLTDNYYYANGTPISFGGTYGDSNVTTLLASLGANVIDSTANITTTGNVDAGYFIGDGSQLTGIVSSYGDSNVATFMAAFGANVIDSTANITTTANVAAAYFIGDGSALTGVTGNYNNSNVTTLLASLGSNIISSTANITTTGNVSGGNLLGIGSGITGINAFGNIAVSGQTTVSADNTTDTLTLVAGTNITLTTDAANNKITITSTASGGGDTLSPFLLMGG